MKRIVTPVLFSLLLTLASTAFGDDSAALYKSKCAMCHGANGAGDTAVGKSMGIKDLASPTIQAKSDAVLAGLISNGVNKMPAFKSQLNATQISDVVKYLRTFKK